MDSLYNPGDGYELPWDDWVDYQTRIVIDGTPTPDPSGAPSAPLPTATIKTWLPAQDAIAAIPAIPPTPSQIDYLTQRGWNSWARTIDELTLGSFLSYTVSGVAFLGIGRQNKEGHSLGSFKHGLLVDDSGVWVMESGVKVKQLGAKAINPRIYRQPDEVIVYLNGNYAYKSLIPAAGPLFGYGYLYTSGDTITSAAFTTGSVKFGRV